MKNLKRIGKITAFILLGLIGVLFAAPLLFKGKILAFARDQINKNIRAKADFSDVDISFFRHFPRVAVVLDNLSIAGTGEFAHDTLISAKKIDVAVNLMSILSGDEMKVYSVTIDEPRIHAIVNKQGHANWDISVPDTVQKQAGGSGSFRLQLERYTIKNGYVKYVDEPGNMSSEITSLDHTGSGDFTADIFTLSTKTSAGAVTFVYGGIPYLNGTKTNIDADIEINNTLDQYRFNTSSIELNNLRLAAQGLFRFVNDSTYGMDISFRSPSTEFRDILSLVPAIYRNDFKSVKTSGQASFDGFVKGNYSSTSIPAYAINLAVTNGSFQYPDLPKPVKDINLVVKVTNPDGKPDNTVIDIPKGHIAFGTDPFDFRLLLKKPMTDQYIDAAAKGRLDLGQITQFVKLDPGTKLAGTVNADVAAKGNVAVISQQKPGEFSAKGFLDIKNLYYASNAFPQPIQHTSARINIDNPDGVPDHTTLHIPAAHVEVGQDAADITLMVKTPASDPAFDGTINGSLNLANVKQFYAFEPGTTLAGIVNAVISFAGRKSMIDKSQYDALKMAGTVQARDVRYVSKAYPEGATVSNALFTLNPKNIAVNDLRGSFMKTNFNASGAIDNFIGYALKNEPLAGKLQVAADKVDLNKWMGTSGTTDTAAATSAPFEVPKNIDFTLDAKAGEVHYDKVDYRNVQGTLQIRNESVALQNVKTEALDGTIAVNGTYSTRVNKATPDISLSYDVQNLDVQKTFYAFNTVQKLMPIGKFIAGKITSKMSMHGKLGQDMMPDLTTLTGDGTLLLLQGFLGKFQPLEKMATLLDVTDLREVTIKDIKNSFAFANGKVLVKPFHVKTGDIDMEVAGMHGLDQSLDYTVNLKIPRARFGNKANDFVNSAVAKANAKGVNVKASDMVNLQVKMGGTITSPQLKTDLKQGAANLAEDFKQQATDFAKQKTDSTTRAVTTAVKDSLESAKKQVKKGVEDEIKKQLFTSKDSTQNGTDTRKNLEETGKGLIKKLNPFGKKKNN